MQKEAFEATGLIPRSIIRTFERFLQQLLPGSESIAIREYRLSRYQIRVSIKSLFQLICIPILVNYTVKPFLLRPIVQYVWDSRQEQLFLNHDQQKQAFRELHNFSETLFFDALLQDTHTDIAVEHFYNDAHLALIAKSFSSQSLKKPIATQKMEIQNANPQAFLPSFTDTFSSLPAREHNTFHDASDSFSNSTQKVKGTGGGQQLLGELNSPKGYKDLEASQSLFAGGLSPPGSKDPLEKVETLEAKKAYQLKSLEIAQRYNTQSILAITNVFGDLLTFVTVSLLFVVMRPQIIILQSFITEFIYSLSDTSKSFLLILGMDLLVGFHSPRAWELALQALLAHVGFPENENFILLFVALFPVFLDTVFKYWIFRYLNKISPSTVVTYHSMLE